MLKFYNQAKVFLYIQELEQNGPVFLEVHPTLACNHKCVWCRYGHDASKLSYKDMAKSLATYPHVKGVRISGGGEPLSNKDATLQFITRCGELGIAVGIETNGGLLDDESIRIIANTCRYCRISLDAVTAETHEKLHQSKDFERVCDNISKLRQAGIPELGLSYLIVPENVREILELPSLRLPVDYIHFKPLIVGIDKKTRNLAMLVLEHWEKTGLEPTIRWDRIVEDDMGNTRIPCRITKLIRVIGGDGKEYVCCEKAYEPEFEVGVWNGSTRKCLSCRYNGYNELLEGYYKNTISREFL